jgi:hypothetical protein
MSPGMSAPVDHPRDGQGSPVSRPQAPDVIVRELERRLRILERADESVFGGFTALDWAVTVLGSVVLPLLLIWWAA